MNKPDYRAELEHLIDHAHSIFNVKSSNLTTDPFAQTERKYLYNVLYLDKTEQDNICGLYFFIRKHPELSELQIKKIVSRNKDTFPALQFLFFESKNLISSLKTLGFNNTCSNIVKDRMLLQSNNNLY